MTPDSANVPLDALLEHEAFVRALARRLLNDAHAADDLAQDTWTDLLVHPPRAVRSVRAWLARSTKNRAANATRSADRRTRHERSAMRVEGDVERDVLERVELESRVVQAVLALKDPYRSVVLGRYYEGLSTRELAERQGVTESTVRSQETRALERLRAELDRTFDGGRAAWGVALAGWVGESSPASTTVAGWSLGLASAAGVATVAWLAWSALDTPTTESPNPLDGDIALASGGNDSSTTIDAPIEADPERRSQTEPATSPSSASRPDFATAPLDELLVLGQQIQRELREKLLTPAPDHTALYERFPRDEYGVARVLERALFGSVQALHVEATGIREGGAYFSIVTREHSFDELPTFGLEGGRLQIVGLGGFLPIAVERLDDLPSSATEAPAGMDAKDWRALWAEVTGASNGERSANFSAHARQLESGAPARPGATYMVRAFQDTDYDVLGAVRVLAADEHGRTIAWRLIRSWPVAPRGWERHPEPPAPTLPVAPEWLAALDLQGLLELQADLRWVAGPRILRPTAELSEADTARVLSGEWSSARLLNPGRYEPILDVGGGGAWVDLDTGDRAFSPGTKLYLGNDVFRAGGWGGCFGVVIALGDVDLDEVTQYGSHLPDRFDDVQRAQWELAWSVRAHAGADGLLRVIPREASVRAAELGMHSGAKARERSTYLARVIPHEANAADLAAAFRVVHADEHGYTLVWRVLQRFPLASSGGR